MLLTCFCVVHLHCRKPETQCSLVIPTAYFSKVKVKSSKALSSVSSKNNMSSERYSR